MVDPNFNWIGSSLSLGKRASKTLNLNYAVHKLIYISVFNLSFLFKKHTSFIRPDWIRILKTK